MALTVTSNISSSVASKDMGVKGAELKKKILLPSPKLNGVDPMEVLKQMQEINQEKHDEWAAKIDLKKSSLESLDKLEALVANLYEAASSLNREISISGKVGDFSKLKTSVVSGSTEAVYLDASALASPQTIAVEVLSLATADTVQAGSGVNNPSAALGVQGILVIAGQNITLTSGMGLQDIVSSINGKTSETDVYASITKVNGAYFLSYSSQVTGKPIVVDNSSVALNGAPSFLPPTSVKSVEDLSAQVKLRGFDAVLSYPTNTIQDQGKGLTFMLKAEGVATLQVEPDIEAAGQGIMKFIDAYNELFNYSKDNKDFPNLTSSLKGLLGIIQDGVKGGVYEENGIHNDFRSLMEMGLTSSGGEISYNNNTEWVHKLKTSFDQMARAFGFDMATSDARVSLLKRPHNIPDSLWGMEIIITKSQDQYGHLTALADIGGNLYPLKVDPDKDYLLIAEGNNPLAGFTFSYNADVNTPVSVRFSQGIADQLKQKLAGYVDPNNGFLKSTRSSIMHEEKALITKLEEFDKTAEDKIERQKLKLASLVGALQKLEKINNYFSTIYRKN